VAQFTQARGRLQAQVRVRSAHACTLKWPGGLRVKPGEGRIPRRGVGGLIWPCPRKKTRPDPTSAALRAELAKAGKRRAAGPVASLQHGAMKLARYAPRAGSAIAGVSVSLTASA